MSVRLVLQGVDQVSLLVDNESKYVRAGRGVLIYVAFLKDGEVDNVSEAQIEKAVHTLLHTKIFTHLCPERMVTGPQALCDHPHVDLVIVPQASLGGKAKGTGVQFHQLLDKDKSQKAYETFCHLMRIGRGVDEETVDRNGVKLPAVAAARPDIVAQDSNWIKYEGRVLSGTFGNRQGLKMESDGPFTHYLEIK